MIAERKRKYLLRGAPTEPIAALPPQTGSDDRSRLEQIRDLAYAKAVERGFTNGSPDDDWLAAETEIDAMLAGRE